MGPTPRRGRRGRGPRARSRTAPPRGGRASRRGGRSPPWPARPSCRRRRAWPGAGRTVRCGAARCTGSGRAPGRGPRHRSRPGSRQAFAPPTRGASGGRPRAGTGHSCRRGRAPGRGRRHRSPCSSRSAPPQIVRASPTARQAAASGFASALRRNEAGSGGPADRGAPGRASSANVLSRNSASNVSRPRADGADDAVLVDRDDDRDGRRLQEIDRVVEDRPVEPLPLGEQPAAVGVLLLGDAQEDQASLLHPLASRFVPDRHVLSAADSPRGELDQQHLLAAEIRQRAGARSPIVGRVKSGCLSPTFGA